MKTKDIPAPDKQPEEMLKHSTTPQDIYVKEQLDSKADAQCLCSVGGVSPELRTCVSATRLSLVRRANDPWQT